MTEQIGTVLHRIQPALKRDSEMTITLEWRSERSPAFDAKLEIEAYIVLYHGDRPVHTADQQSNQFLSG